MCEVCAFQAGGKGKDLNPELGREMELGWRESGIYCGVRL